MPTTYFVVAFARSDDGKLAVVRPVAKPSEGVAIVSAQIEAAKHVGAVAVSHPDGSSDEFELLCSYGEVDLGLLSDGDGET